MIKQARDIKVGEYIKNEGIVAAMSHHTVFHVDLIAFKFDNGKVKAFEAGDTMEVINHGY